MKPLLLLFAATVWGQSVIVNQNNIVVLSGDIICTFDLSQVSCNNEVTWVMPKQKVWWSSYGRSNVWASWVIYPKTSGYDYDIAAVDDTIDPPKEVRQTGHFDVCGTGPCTGPKPNGLLTSDVGGAAGTGTWTSKTMDSTEGTMATIQITNYQGPPLIERDNAGNTYQQVAGCAAGPTNVTLFKNTGTFIPKAAHVFQVSGNYGTAIVSIWKGWTEFDGAVCRGQLNTSSMAESLQPSGDNELILTGIGNRSTGIWSTGPIFTSFDGLVFKPNVVMGIDMAYEMQTTAAARSVTWSGPATTDIAVLIATFK